MVWRGSGRILRFLRGCRFGDSQLVSYLVVPVSRRPWGGRDCEHISCNVAQKRAHLALAGSWPLRGVAVALPSRDSCISPTVGQWNCGRISCTMTRIDCYNALPDLLRLQEPGTAGPFRTFRRLRKSDPGRIRTDDLEIRSFLLYPTELRGRKTTCAIIAASGTYVRRPPYGMPAVSAGGVWRCSGIYSDEYLK